MKKTISLYVEPGQLKRLKLWSKETGAPVSELIRRAIETALKAKEDQEKG
jgi:predicted DNA-binding protein